MPTDWSSQDEASPQELQAMRQERKAKLKAEGEADAAALKEKFGPPLPSPEDTRGRARVSEHSDAVSEGGESSAASEGGGSALGDMGRRAMRGPSAFRYSDSELGGEARTSATEQGGLYETASAEVQRRDGTADTAGTARFTTLEDKATLDHDSFVASNYGTEEALLREVSERAAEKGARSLRVWVQDGDSQAEQRWLSHGFHATQRDPGAAGIYWQKLLSATDD